MSDGRCPKCHSYMTTGGCPTCNHQDTNGNYSRERHVLAELQRMQDAIFVISGVNDLAQTKRMMRACLLQTTYFMSTVKHTPVDFDIDEPN